MTQDQYLHDTVQILLNNIGTDAPIRLLTAFVANRLDAGWSREELAAFLGAAQPNLNQIIPTTQMEIQASEAKSPALREREFLLHCAYRPRTIGQMEALFRWGNLVWDRHWEFWPEWGNQFLYRNPGPKACLISKRYPIEELRQDFQKICERFAVQDYRPGTHLELFDIMDTSKLHLHIRKAKLILCPGSRGKAYRRFDSWPSVIATSSSTHPFASCEVEDSDEKRYSDPFLLLFVRDL